MRASCAASQTPHQSRVANITLQPSILRSARRPSQTRISTITPTSAAEKPAGEWQSLDITLVKRHVTVVLNGTKIIDNQPLLGCTGGALWSDESRPGPIYLQGDHTGVEYRDIVLRPVVQ